MIEQIKNLHKHNVEGVLATIIQVDGSAYRREGVKMIFTQSGKQWGTISAGCLEEDLRVKAEEVFTTKTPEILTYDMTSEEDLIWGTGSGCNGKIDVLVESVSWMEVPPLAQEPFWPKVESLLSDRITVAVARSLWGRIVPSATLLYTSEGQIFGSLGDPEIEARVAERCQQFLGSGQDPQVMELPEWDACFFLDRYSPKERLYLFGAGPDAEPVINMASKVGFETTVIDSRSSRCNKQFFPSAKECMIAHPQESLADIEINNQDFVILMTHNFQRDKELLADLMDRNPYYIGILGSKRRTSWLLNGKQLSKMIHSPIGLSIGAEGPEEIAVSIVAELIKVRNEKGC